ncbi:PDZ domain-containing protein [Heliobacterium chlorum]|uniref:PDZ domain-containing protein n=1 Tax=Heliobacterium chlorum TaxID=2698 RepID=A0ABR7T0X1_HELCL|nr:PDZ domain-containing protein [Heliobacterium chlorum]MBC9784439.1 PDZ domain-containing protein [Heliobacterium chlorum]
MVDFNGWDLLNTIIQGFEILLLYPLEYPTFWVFLLIIALLYRRQLRMKSELFQVKTENVWHSVFSSAMYGLVGGFIGSFLMILFGVTIVESGFLYLLPVAIALALINTRYMCYAYAGGVISLAAIFLGWTEVSVVQIMGLVAILHLVEAVLMFLSGHRDSLPVYVAHRRGMTVGGYHLQSFWPIPLVVLTMVAIPHNSGIPFQEISTPGWWPLISPPDIPYNPAVESVVLSPLPLVALLGYGDLALVRQPRVHCRRSSLMLAGYSLILLSLVVLASHIPMLSLLPALFGPLGHEALILWTKRREMQGTPLYVTSPRGLKILDVGDGSPAEKAGLRAGDLLGSVNGLPVRSRRDLAVSLSWSPAQVEMEFLPGGTGGVWKRATAIKGWNESLGLIPVPDPEDPPLIRFEGVGLFGNLWRNWSQRFFRRNRDKP